jgi:hypothetical protein
LKLKNFAIWICALSCAPFLSGCGGSSSNSGTANLRLLNATHDYGAVDFYTSDTLALSAVAEGTASTYLGYTEGSYAFKIKPAGTSTTALSNSLSLSKDTNYTLVAYNNGSTLATTYFTDTQAAPTSGTAAVRIFNGATSSGYVDVYVTASDADFATATPTASSVSGASITSYVEITKGTYRIRVTGYGDKTDIRLDIPSVTLSDQQIATLMLTGTNGGVLVNALMVNQGGTVTAYKNANARLRVVAAVTGNGSVTASTTDGTVSSTLQAPTVGSYVSRPATLAGLAVAVNGVAVDVSAVALTAGSDATLLVYGDAAAPQVKLLVDDNSPATVAANAKIRLVNLLNGLGSTMTLNADYVAVADNVAFGAASTPESITASSTIRLEVTTPVRTTPLYSAADVSLTAAKVYTMFVMGDASAPVAVLRKDR